MLLGRSGVNRATAYGWARKTGVRGRGKTGTSGHPTPGGSTTQRARPAPLPSPRHLPFSRGGRGRAAPTVPTMAERSTRYVMLGQLPGGHTAEEVRDVLVPLVQTLPERLATGSYSRATRGTRPGRRARSAGPPQRVNRGAGRSWSVSVERVFADMSRPWTEGCGQVPKQGPTSRPQRTLRQAEKGADLPHTSHCRE